MRSLVFGLLTVLVMTAALVVSPAHAFAAEGSIKSYREWKTSKVQEAEARLEGAKARAEARKKDPNLTKRPGTEAVDTDTQKVESQLRSEKMAVDLAKELSVSDYFAGYLAKVSDKNAAFKQVAGKLSPEEVADLMMAYANSIFGSQGGNLPISAQNLGRETVK